MSTGRLLRTGLDTRWLIAALSVQVFFQFALDGGGSETAIWVAGLLLCVHAVHGDCAIRTIPARLLAVAGLALLLLSVSWTFSFELTDTHRSLRILKFLILVFSVYCVARIVPGEVLTRVAATVAALTVLWQLAIRHLDGSPYGSFLQSHYLAYFIVLLLPPIVLLAYRLEKPYRYALLLLLVPALDLILNDLSKPLIPLLSLAGAAGVTLFVVAVGWRRWAAILWFGLVFSGTLYLAPQAADFFLRDERSTIWADTARLIASGNWQSWLFGLGLGSFPEHFPDFSAPEFAYLAIPHNHVLEVLYESGFLLLLVGASALVYLASRSVKLVWVLDDLWLRRLALCNLAMLVSWFLFSFSAFSVYSSYSLYPLAFIVGIHLSLADRMDGDRDGSG